MTLERKITEYKNELPPVYKTWLDWYFALKQWAKKEDVKLTPEMDASYNYMPLERFLHDDTVVHWYHTTIGYIQAKVFGEIEELINNLDGDSLVKYHFDARISEHFVYNEKSTAIDNILHYLIDYSWRNKQINKNNKT